MSATDELRRMLDERGVEWWEDAFSGEHRTVFDGKDGVRYCVYQLGCSLFISSILPVTPEQAIEATLWRGTCRNVGESMLFVCSECGCVVSNRTHTERVFEIPDYGDEYWADKRPLRYCPNCGRKVMD